MYGAAHRSSSGAINCVCSLWFIYPCGDRPLSRLSEFLTQPWQRPVTTCVYKPEAANTIYSSWRWAVCRSKHVEPSVNLGIINSITSRILLVFLLSHTTMHGSMNISFQNSGTHNYSKSMLKLYDVIIVWWNSIITQIFVSLFTLPPRK
jgi:hypothetical protein